MLTNLSMTVIFYLSNRVVKTTSYQQAEDSPAGSRKCNDLQLGTSCLTRTLKKELAFVNWALCYFGLMPPDGDMRLLQLGPGVLVVG